MYPVAVNGDDAPSVRRVAGATNASRQPARGARRPLDTYTPNI